MQSRSSPNLSQELSEIRARYGLPRDHLIDLLSQESDEYNRTFYQAWNHTAYNMLQRADHSSNVRIVWDDNEWTDAFCALSEHIFVNGLGEKNTHSIKIITSLRAEGKGYNPWDLLNSLPSVLSTKEKTCLSLKASVENARNFSSKKRLAAWIRIALISGIFGDSLKSYHIAYKHLYHHGSILNSPLLQSVALKTLNELSHLVQFEFCVKEPMLTLRKCSINAFKIDIEGLMSLEACNLTCSLAIANFSNLQINQEDCQLNTRLLPEMSSREKELSRQLASATDTIKILRKSLREAEEQAATLKNRCETLQGEAKNLQVIAMELAQENQRLARLLGEKELVRLQ